jgi:exopolysaccharide biosynthesis polyprenyl glycosylphosphotransferase
MYRQQVAFIINVLMIADAMIIILGGYLAAYIRWRISDYTWSVDSEVHIGLILFLMFVNNFVMGGMGLYSDKRSPSILFTLKRIASSVFIVFSILSVVLVSIKLHDISRSFLLMYALIMLTGFFISRLILEFLFSRTQTNGFNSRKIIIVGTGPRAESVYNALMNQKSWGHQVVGLIKPDEKEHVLCDKIPCLGTLDDFGKILAQKSVDEVIFALEPDCARDIKDILGLCEKFGLGYKIIPALYNPKSLYLLQVEHIQGIPTISKQMVSIDAAGLFYKRLVDFGMGLLGMIIFLVMYPFVALAIKLESPGPVLFRQKRVGQNGRIFDIYKFRTMNMDAEKQKNELMAKNVMQGLMFKVENDPRMTRVGKFLRKTSLDEIPQFINVIKGEMSLVGTRPPTLDEVEKYEPWHRRRISMKPGITGLWQVSGRNKITDFNEVVKLDLKYIDHWRFANDIKIILQTIWVVLRRKGAF